ncbi:hypothetical protein [Lysobacter sp. M15]|uniref:hypothetical protein n=1 Tax=Lysobacter sp. M15 TaxID=2916837 RepID=UPI001F57AE53|nr:hypothetical protein [Lysobacter sp. M15]
MSTRQSRRRSVGKLRDASISDPLQRLTSVQVGRNVHEVDVLAIRVPTQVRSELNGSRSSEFNAVSDFVSGNTAGLDHAPDIDGACSAPDGSLPIYFNTSLPTRH